MLQAYRQHVAERAALGIPPLPLTEAQTAELTTLLANPPAGEEKALVELLIHRVPAGVDDAARVKAAFLASVAKGTEKVALVSREKATELLGTMLGGFNVKPLIDLLDDAQVGAIAAEGLKKTLLVFDAFADVKAKADAGNAQRQGRAEVLGRGGMVHQPPRGAPEPHPDRLQGHGRDQHRRPLPRPRRLEPPRHPAPRPGHAQERPPRHHPR